MVELAVIRGISKNLPISNKLYGWLSKVINTAYDLHPGLVQSVVFGFFLSKTQPDLKKPV